MPQPAVVPAILIKSVLLAITAGYVASKFQKVNIALLMGVVAFYQFFGSLAEWALTGSAAAALQDVCLALPGITLQILGGYIFIKYVLRK